VDKRLQDFHTRQGLGDQVHGWRVTGYVWRVARVGSRGLFFAFDGVLELEDGKVELNGSFGIAGL
jgi:hypothetical protein